LRAAAVRQSCSCSRYNSNIIGGSDVAAAAAAAKAAAAHKCTPMTEFG